MVWSLQMRPQTRNMSAHIHYLYDPFCGWCYGASPAIAYLSAMEGVSLEILPTAMFEGARPLDPSFVRHIIEADKRITQMTGQVFSQAYEDKILKAPGQIIESRPAGLALSAVHLSAPDQEVKALKAIQEGRYIHARNIADKAVLADILQNLGLSEAAQCFLADDQALHQAHQKRTQKGQALMTRFAARGVPCLILNNEAGSRQITSDYLFGKPEALKALI